MSRGIKRLIDVMAAATALLLLAPVMAWIAIAIRLTMGPPVAFPAGPAGAARDAVHPGQVQDDA